MQKKNDRQSMIRKSTKLSEEQKETWLKVVSNNDFMSSEESDGDNILIHSIPWRAKLVNTVFKKIDELNQKSRSSQSRRQTKTRKVGSCSVRPLPEDATIPSWAVQK